DHPLAARIVAERRPRPAETRRGREADGAEPVRPALRRVVERHAAAGTAGLAQEPGRGEAIRAEPAGRLDDRIAGQAMRRQDKVERGAAGPPGEEEKIGHGRDRAFPDPNRQFGTTAYPSRCRATHRSMKEPDHRVFDRRAVRLHRDRAAGTVGRVADLLHDAAGRLLDRLDDTTRRFTHALDLGGRGVVAPMLRARGIDTVSADISPTMATRNPAPAIAADEEFLPFGPGSFDLIVASLALHWTNDLPGALIQFRRALAPDGLFLASLPALGTAAELRTALAEAETALRGGASPRVSPFPDLRDCAALLQRAGFAFPVADGEEIRLHYAD